MTKVLTTVRLSVAGGVAGWIITKLMLFSEYVDSVGGMDNVVWPTVFGAALPIILDGLIAIGALKIAPKPEGSAKEPAKPVQKPRIEPDFDSFDTASYDAVNAPKPEVIAVPRVEPEKATQDAVQVVKEPTGFGYYPGRVFSQRSLDNLAECHPDLLSVATRALQLSAYDFTVIAGSRDVETQKALVKAGKSLTMNSRHLQTPSHAFDFMAIGPDGATWEVEPYYQEIVRAMKHAGRELGISIVCGIDWKTLVDAGHIELDRSVYPDVIDVQLS